MAQQEAEQASVARKQLWVKREKRSNKPFDKTLIKRIKPWKSKSKSNGNLKLETSNKYPKSLKQELF